MKAVIQNNELVLFLPLQRPTPSKSGKTLLVATSGGTRTTKATVDGKPVVVGVNAFIKP